MSVATARAVRVDVTPQRKFPLGGFAARLGDATGTHQPLEVNALVLDVSGSVVTWVGVDALAITDPLRDALRAAVQRALRSAGIAGDRILVVATHTHSAPAVWHGTIHPVLPADLDRDEIARIAGLLEQECAAAPAVPVTFDWQVAEITGVGSNRHAADGVVDQSAGVLTVRAAETGHPLAVLFDFACHPTVLGPENLDHSPDWVGGARLELRQRLDARALPVVFAPGCAGDVSTRFERRGRGTDEAERLGRIVGRVVAGAVADAGGLDADSLEVRSEQLTVATRTRFDDIEDAASARPVVQGAAAAAVTERVRGSLAEGEASRAAFLATRLPATRSFDITVVDLGGVRWLLTPFEIASQLGPAIGLSPTTRIIGYANGYGGYLADDESFRRGHYEALASFCSRAETQRVVGRLSALAKRAP